MPRVAVYNTQGERVGEIELSETVFGAPIKPALMHQAVVMYLANQRRGTAATKTRGMVRGGGRKPWRQKGTGRARQGSIRAPQWRKGGVVFGPQPRDYSQTMPKKARRAALRSALSAKVADGELIVLEGLSELGLERPRTKEFAALIKRLDLEGKRPLFILPRPDPTLYLSARNLPDVDTEYVDRLNVYKVLRHGHVVLAREAVDRVEEVLGA
ncbi:MAG: 50S ribosomal protein L4 [Bacillota bacterium]|nr:MAG: 50S ribosomal protein L4 [Bacillota bacterium]